MHEVSHHLQSAIFQPRVGQGRHHLFRREAGRLRHDSIERFVLAPTLGQPPVKLGQLDTMNRDVKPYARLIGEYSPFTAMFNITGQPSASMPMHTSAEGLPVGVMLTAKFGDEVTVLRAARALEEASA